MEIELKYAVPSTETAESIWKDVTSCRAGRDDPGEELCFSARYFDTADGDLAGNDIAYRVRKEGRGYAATIKWQGRSKDALHERQEINVPVCSGDSDPSVFKESDIGKKMLDIVGDKMLQCIMETRVRRRRLKIDTGNGVFELSVDEGRIVTPYGEGPIMELELELFSGTREELERVGERLRDRYGLKEEEKSKFTRGMEIIEKNKEK